jgi:hypothetical protein
MDGARNAYGGVERPIQRNLKGRDRLGDTGGDGLITLRWIFTKWYVGIWTGSSWLRMGKGGGDL